MTERTSNVESAKTVARMAIVRTTARALAGVLRRTCVLDQGICSVALDLAVLVRNSRASTIICANCFRFTINRPKQLFLDSTPLPASSCPAVRKVSRLGPDEVIFSHQDTRHGTSGAKAPSTYSTCVRLAVTFGEGHGRVPCGLQVSGWTSWEKMGMSVWEAPVLKFKGLSTAGCVGGSEG